MGEGRPLGTIVDYFWRIKFQEGGSPHIHRLLWVKNVPDLSTSGEGVIPPGNENVCGLYCMRTARIRDERL